jgi:hypothetical protein
MANLRQHLNRVAERIRALPVRLGERPTTVTIEVREWSGRRVGDGSLMSTTSTVITPAPKVREVSLREIAGSGGRYEAGDVRVGPITPAYDTGVATGGYTSAQLAPLMTRNALEVVYVLAGWMAGEYLRTDLESDKSHQFYLVLRKNRATP